MSSLLFGNGTDIVHWKPNPTTRGTFGLLTTCLITLLLCIWTAVHLNVSPPGSFWQPFWRKVGWLILALLAPEMVAYTAWSQRQQAVEIMRTVNYAFERPNPTPWYTRTLQCTRDGITKLRRFLNWQTQKPVRQPTLEAQKAASPDKDRPWTIVHGFYVAMGGLALDLPRDLPESEQFVPNWACGTWFIKLSGLYGLLTMDKALIPSLTEEEIKSKSKANGLAKALVCAQASWFLATCVTRWAQSIPISLLELNTFGHAVCALFIYLLWWEKPFEVDIPTIVHSEALLDMYALAWVNTKDTRGGSPLVRSMKSAYRDLLQANEEFHRWSKDYKTKLSKKYPKRERHLFTSLDTVAFLDSVPPKFCLAFRRLRQGFPRIQDSIETAARQPDLNEHLTSTKYMPGEHIPDTGLKLRSALEDEFGNPKPTALPSLRLTKQDINRWKMAKRAAESIGKLSDHENFSGIPFERRCTNMPDLFETFDEPPLVFGFSAAAMIYGGLHALAWSAHFHSPTEQLLWRISSVVVMGGIPTLAVMFGVSNQLRDSILGDSDHDWTLHLVLFSLFRLVFYSFIGLNFLIAIAYVLARLYLVVECFIQLSHLPAGVYEVPEWSAYFPHIA